MNEHPEYRQYRKKVPMIIPFVGKRQRKNELLEGLGSEA
jgi:hypothetical protein